MTSLFSINVCYLLVFEMLLLDNVVQRSLMPSVHKVWKLVIAHNIHSCKVKVHWDDIILSAIRPFCTFFTMVSALCHIRFIECSVCIPAHKFTEWVKNRYLHRSQFMSISHSNIYVVTEDSCLECSYKPQNTVFLCTYMARSFHVLFSLNTFFTALISDYKMLNVLSVFQSLFTLKHMLHCIIFVHQEWAPMMLWNTPLWRDWGRIKALHRNTIGVHANLHIANPDICLLWFFWGHQACLALRQNEDKEFWKCRSEFSVQKALQDFALKAACLTEDTIKCFPEVHLNKDSDMGALCHISWDNRWRTDTSVIQMCAVIISLCLYKSKLQTNTGLLIHFIVNWY